MLGAIKPEILRAALFSEKNLCSISYDKDDDTIFIPLK